MATYVVTASEDGLEDPIGVYTVGASPMVIGSTARAIGMRFTGFPTFSDGIRTRADSVLKSVQLRLTTDNSVTGTLVVGFVDELAPAVFSGVNLPSAKFDTMTQAAFLVYTTTGPQNVTIPINLGRLTFRQRSTNWNGSLAFVLLWSDALATMSITSGEAGANQPTLVTEELNYVTGLVGYGDAQSRIDRCPRCGRLQPREMFVPDGFRPGILVCARCYDEPDLVHKTGIQPGRERPGVNENR